MESRGSLSVCLFVSVFLICDVYGQVASLCRPNERFLSCGGCQKTCEDPSPVCIAVCREGCYCSDEEVRNATGHCVKIADCPSVSKNSHLHTSEPRSTDSQCPENEEYRFCETCNKTCDNPNPMCPAQCARGCFCKDDLVRDKDGRCVKVAECSNLKKNENSNYIKPIAYELTCGPHQLYKDCQKCEKTCSNPNPVCGNTCSVGCFCEDGYLKAPSGKCVKLEECPKAEVTMGAQETSVEDCSNDEVYLSCGWCEPSCWDPRPECPPGVCTRGCLCRPPLLRHHSGHCVEDKHCAPQKCSDPGEEFVCRYGCEARCDNQKCPTRPRRCVLGCHCKLGLLRDADFRCVTPDKCGPRLYSFKDMPIIPFPVKSIDTSISHKPSVFKFDIIESFLGSPKLLDTKIPKFKEIVVPKTKTEISRVDLEISPKAFIEVDLIPKSFKEFPIITKVNDNVSSIFDIPVRFESKKEKNSTFPIWTPVAKILPRNGHLTIVDDIKDTTKKATKDKIESNTTKSLDMETSTNDEVTGSKASEEIDEFTFNNKAHEINLNAYVSNILNVMKKMLPTGANFTENFYPAWS